jgi:hypothetical protein
MRSLLALSAMILACLPTLAEASDAPLGIVAIDGLKVTVDQGRAEGLATGDHVAFARTRIVDLGDGEPSVEIDVVVVGEVTAASRHRALVRLGPNEHVEEGMRAMPTERPLTRDLVAPPKSGARWELEAGFSALAVMSVGVGGGFLATGRIERRFGDRGFLRLRVDPSGVLGYRFSEEVRSALTRPETHHTSTTSGVIIAGLDFEYVELGMGFGATRTTRIDETRVTCDGCTATLVRHGFEPGFTFATVARFGARDGLSLDVDAALTGVEGRVEVSRFGARLQVPVTPTLALVARGSTGLGVVGTRTADLGARLLVRGDGGPASTYLTPYIGYAALSERAALDVNQGVHRRPADPLVVHALAAGVIIERRL